MAHLGSAASCTASSAGCRKEPQKANAVAARRSSESASADQQGLATAHTTAASPVLASLPSAASPCADAAAATSAGLAVASAHRHCLRQARSPQFTACSMQQQIDSVALKYLFGMGAYSNDCSCQLLTLNPKP